MYHWKYFVHAINSDRQTRLLNVLGESAMKVGAKKETEQDFYQSVFFHIFLIALTPYTEFPLIHRH